MQSHGTKSPILVSKLRSWASKTNAGPGGLVRVALFWKSHCTTCSPAFNPGQKWEFRMAWVQFHSGANGLNKVNYSFIYVIIYLYFLFVFWLAVFSMTWFNYRLTHSASKLSGFTCKSSLTMIEKFQYRTRLLSSVLKISSSLLVNECR